MLLRLTESSVPGIGRCIRRTSTDPLPLAAELPGHLSCPATAMPGAVPFRPVRPRWCLRFELMRKPRRSLVTAVGQRRSLLWPTKQRQSTNPPDVVPLLRGQQIESQPLRIPRKELPPEVSRRHTCSRMFPDPPPECSRCLDESAAEDRGWSPGRSVLFGKTHRQFARSMVM